MAAVQIWWYTGLVPDTPVLQEPWFQYDSETVSTSEIEVSVPAGAQFAVIETDALIAYRLKPDTGHPAAAMANCPNIAATDNTRYIIGTARGGTLSLIAAA